MQPMMLRRSIFRVSMVMLLSVLVTGAVFGFGRYATAESMQQTVYLPIIFGKPLPTLFGKVTYQGQPMQGIKILLFKWDSVQRKRTELATVDTDAGGSYRFENIGNTADNEWYGAVYQNGENGNPKDTHYVWSCNTNLLSGYTGEYWNLGDFDIADFAILSPPDGATTGLPVTLQWQKRPATPSDSYYVGIYGVSGDTARFRSYDLGYTDRFQLNGLPSAATGASAEGTFEYGTAYSWYPWVSWPRSFCDSYDAHLITFRQ